MRPRRSTNLSMSPAPAALSAPSTVTTAAALSPQEVSMPSRFMAGSRLPPIRKPRPARLKPGPRPRRAGAIGHDARASDPFNLEP